MRKNLIIISFTVLVFLMAVATAALAADPHVGTWKLNLAKSMYDPPSSAPKSQTLKIEAQGDGINYVAEGMDAEGKKYFEHFAAKYDGKDYPYVGSSTADSIAYTRIDASTLDWVVKKDGKVVSSGRSVVSKNGKTRTVTAKGKDEKGQETTRTSVYSKK